jgi:hypothetical protein
MQTRAFSKLMQACLSKANYELGRTGTSIFKLVYQTDFES